MSELRKLRTIRAQIKGQMIRINNFLSTDQDITQTQVRAAKVEELWTAFNDNQTRLEILIAGEEVELEEVLQAEEGERITFKAAYYKALDKVRAVLTATQ